MNAIPNPFERVMLVDDNDIDLLIMSHMIKKNHFAETVSKYSMPAKALEFLETHQNEPETWPQLIFLDIHMPVMTGFEFMAAYSKLSAKLRAYCKVYIISSSNNDKDLVRVKNERDVVGFHEKPMSKAFLEEILMA